MYLEGNLMANHTYRVKLVVEDPSDMDMAIKRMTDYLKVVPEVIGNTIIAIIERVTEDALKVIGKIKDDLFGLHPRLNPSIERIMV
jgi:hypothetical protein